MSAGATLLKLQQIDLELARNKSELANMPELKELASKRKTYVKLKAEMTKLYAQRKDLDIELDDLNTTEIQTNNAIEAAKKRHVDGSDYREVQDLENELATLAKRLDKIEHTRKDVLVAHKEALDREAWYFDGAIEEVGLSDVFDAATGFDIAAGLDAYFRS